MNLAQTAVRLLMADHAVRTEDAALMARDSRAASRAYNRTMLGDEFPEASGPEAEAEADVGIHVGDSTTHHHAAPPGTSALAKAGIAAAIGFATAGPIGAALALPSILQAMRPAQTAPATPSVAPVGTDTDTLFELRLGPPAPAAGDTRSATGHDARP